jgi:hypothetical protein
MNFLIQVILFSKLEHQDYSENAANLSDKVRDFYINKLKKLDSFVSFKDASSQCRYESNHRITAHIKACFKKGTQIKDVLKYIENANVKVAIPALAVDSDSIKTDSWRDCLSDLVMADNKPHLNNISELPKNLSKLLFTGTHAKTASGSPKIHVKAFDVNNNELPLNEFNWVNNFKEDFSKTHTASAMFSITLSHVKKLLLGNHPNKELVEFLNNRDIIKTDKFLPSEAKNPRLYCKFK